jgi:hypothetical protein
MIWDDKLQHAQMVQLIQDTVGKSLVDETALLLVHLIYESDFHFVLNGEQTALEFTQRQASEIVSAFYTGDQEKSNYAYWYNEYLYNVAHMQANAKEYARLAKEILERLSSYPLIQKIDYGGFLPDV